MSNLLDAKPTSAPGSSITGPPPGKWPKVLPPLTPEQKRINDDFMEYWHEVLPRRYKIADRFCHQYVLRKPSAGFRRTLEVGAGLANTSVTRTDPDQEREYVALDSRENMIARLKARFPKIQACQGDCQTRLDFPENYFDRILAINVLEHLPDLPRAIEESTGSATNNRVSFPSSSPVKAASPTAWPAGSPPSASSSAATNAPTNYLSDANTSTSPAKSMRDSTAASALSGGPFSPFPFPSNSATSSSA